jgi:hypothetical protein
VKKVVILVLTFLLGFSSGIFSKYYHDKFTYYNDMRVVGKKDNGLLSQIFIVPDEKTALKIANAVWLPIYGGKSLFGYSYKIELIEGKFWSIVGIQRIKKFFGSVGGGPYVEIDRKTGAILQIGHGGANPKENHMDNAGVSFIKIKEIRQSQ